MCRRATRAASPAAFCPAKQPNGGFLPCAISRWCVRVGPCGRHSEKMLGVYAAAVCLLALVDTTESFTSAPMQICLVACLGRSTRAFPTTECLKSSRLKQQQCGGSRLTITCKVKNDYNGETAGYPLQPTYPSASGGVRTCWVRYFYEGSHLLRVCIIASPITDDAPRRQTHTRRPVFSNGRSRHRRLLDPR